MAAGGAAHVPAACHDAQGAVLDARHRGGRADSSGALKRRRTVWFDGTPTDTPVYDGALLRAGNEFHGPAIIEETTTSVVIPPRYACRVDEVRNYVLTRDGAQVRGTGAAAGERAQLVGGAA
ncbi:MAG: hypothetical protein R3C32_01265 [Chloroflexota bacterium]